MLDFSDDPHRRYNILNGEWVLVSPHRNKRPWQGKVESAAADVRPSYDPACYLCPGNTRAGGQRNPQYRDTFVFTNDFAALKPDSSAGLSENGLLKARGERGICKVVCFSPDHALTLPDMEVEAIEKVVDLWQHEYRELGALEFINHVQIFENKGAIMGCSNPHPHGQIWAQDSVPLETAKKTERQLKYWQARARSLLLDYLQQELEAGERLVCDNAHFVALVPFWAIWPYETMIIPRRHVGHIGMMGSEEKKAFAALLKDLTQRYDRLFDTSFPYSAGMHQSPTDGQAHEEWHFHMAFYPPLLRSATVKKFMVGYEMFADPQRDITAETAAEQLRNV
ncbi:MAG: UDP-glucose--hexose-1-phosphate uridylyltransferase [Saprospiraceae bacterium]|nr:UDP-glucose--hexose-1-phosphate uridylyltransferase [Saprospiraceae bacterium]